MTNFYGHFEISRAFLEIDEKFESMESFVPKTSYDMQILSLFSQYMVIFITRTVEGSVKNIIYTKSRLLGKSESEIKQIETQLRDFQNPNKEKIFFYFDDILNIQLNKEVFDDNQFGALGQIVKDRHRIAHSDHLLSTMQYLKSLDDIKKHYNDIKIFVSELCKIINSC